MKNLFDTIVVGGGPAGLSCALVLGRCRRKVIVFDTARQRNKVSMAMHAFPSREGENPQVFLNKVKNELSDYGIRIRKKEVVRVAKRENFFEIHTSDGKIFAGKKLLLATGLRDELPPLKGAEKYYGRGVFHCPYCDGWEHRDEPWVIYTTNARAAVEVCLRLKTWSSSVSLLTAYVKRLSKKEKDLLVRNGVGLISSEVKELVGRNGKLEFLCLEGGDKLPCSALFFSNPPKQQCNLAEKLGCRITRKGHIDFNRLQQTNVQGLYAAGDAARDMQLMIIAAAEGAKAAVVINAELNKEERLS